MRRILFVLDEPLQKCPFITVSSFGGLGEVFIFPPHVPLWRSMFRCFKSNSNSAVIAVILILILIYLLFLIANIAPSSKARSP